MELNVNANGWGMMFGVPVAVVDKYLKLATPSQLKVLLYLLRHQYTSIDTNAISEALSMNEELVEEAVLFWEQTDIFISNENKSVPAIQTVSQPEASAQHSESHPRVIAQRSSSDISLTPSEIAAELKRDAGLM